VAAVWRRETDGGSGENNRLISAANAENLACLQKFGVSRNGVMAES